MNSKIIGVLVVAAVAGITWAKWPKASDREQVERAVAAANAETPKNIDTVTTLYRVELQDHVVTNRYSVSQAMENNATVTAAMRQTALQQACSNQAMHKMLAMGYSIESLYDVRTQSGPERIRILVEPHDCH